MSSQKLLETVDRILEKANIPDRHTYFQLEKFNIGREPTAQAQLWQIVKELQARRETVDAFTKDLADAEDNLELFDIKIDRLEREIRQMTQEESAFSDLDIREREIGVRKLQREKESLIKSAQKVKKKLEYTLEEMTFLANGFESIVSQVGEMKPLDDTIAQKEAWNERLLEEFNLRILLQRPLDPELVKTIMCLHDDAPVKQHLTKVLQATQERMLAQGAQQQKIAKPQIEPRAKIVGK